MRKIKMKLILSFLIVVFTAMNGFAQERTILGKVLTEDGNPISGASIILDGTDVGTQTDNNGTFQIKANQGQTLTVSSVGFQDKTVVVGAENSMTINLVQENTTLKDVVIVGYGTQQRSDLTGAVSTINVSQNLTNRPVADIGRGLQGVSSGLSVTLPSGEIGSDPIMKIRGAITSFEGTSNPLILLDNVEIPSIQVVNPNDIANITILKDAASASIYGAKAANGVILITTKKGAGSSTPQVTYTGNISWQNIWKDLNMADVDALKYTVDASERIGTTTPTGAFYLTDRNSYEKAVEWKQKYGNTIGKNDPTVYGRDWYVQNGFKMGVRTYDPYDYMIREWAPTNQHDLTVGQRVGNTTYNVGLGYLHQSGMIKPADNDFTKYNASLRLSSEVNKYLTIRASSLLSNRNKRYPYATNSTTADPWLYLYRWAPTYPFGYDENGNPTRSPVSEYMESNIANIRQNYQNVSLGATLNFTKNWTFDFDYTYSNQNESQRRPGTRFTAANTWVAAKARVDDQGNPVYVNDEGKVVSESDEGAIRAYDLSNDTYTSSGGNPDHIYAFELNQYNTTINAFSTYNWDVTSDNHFKFMVGLNRVSISQNWHSQQQNQLTDIHNPEFNFAVGTPPIIGADRTWESQMGFFGRINYDYKGKYLIEGNLRRDGSSKFPERLWWRWFPSASVGWIVTQEKFMENVNFLNFMKIRGSWGKIGDQTVPNSLYLSLMESGLSTWIISGNKTPFVGTPASVMNQVTWQDVETKDLGVDFGLLQNRLTINFDLYQRDTKNMLVPEEGIPLTYGTGAPVGNFGSLRTNGWELTVEFNHRFENGVGINFHGNLANSKTKILQYGSDVSVNGNYNGKTIGEIWGYRTDRLYQKSDFDLDADGNLQLITLTANDVPAQYADKTQAYKLKPGPHGEKPVYQVFLQNSSNFLFGPGDVKFKDVNGDGFIDNGSASLSDHGDLEVIGNSNPRYEYGFRLGADYKGFDLSVFIQGVGSRQVWGDGFLAIPGYNSADGAMPQAIAGDYWTPDHTDAFYPAAYNNAASNTANNMQVQDRYLLNMAYIRLKNLTFGYTIPQNIVGKAKINSLRVYAALENFVTWDHLRGLPIDPEYIDGYSMWNGSNYNLGRTGMGVPAFKSISLGVQLTF